MKCRVCGEKVEKLFSSKILSKYKVHYFYCNNCNFLQTQEPSWLEEAYREPINIYDTGLLARNVYLSKIVSVIIYFFFRNEAAFLDFAGGYGVFTRLMRDIGFDYYWHDLYSTNLLARGFEYNNQKEIELITSFESFEHFIDPVGEIGKMLQISTNILITTEILPAILPKPEEWWYYGLDHGQHISFYSTKTLKHIAEKFGLKMISNGVNLHLFTKQKINIKLFRLALKYNDRFLFKFVNKRMKSKTFHDMKLLIERTKGNNGK